MTVGQLIEQLQKLPEHYDVMLYYDGAPRLICDGAFHTQNEEMYDNSSGEYIISSNAVVLCGTNDVYQAGINWFFKKEGY